MLVDNNQLRSEIDHLLIERATFNKQYHKLIDRLATTKQKTSEIIDQATQAYDQRYVSSVICHSTRLCSVLYCIFQHVV